MRRVGLTGGIASGKSTITDIFRSLDVPVVDADEISHALMQPEQAGFQQALNHYGPQILKDDGTLDRRQLRQLVFNNPVEKQWLEDMLHPLIREACITQMQQHQSTDYVLLVVPLMFETGFNDLVEVVITIDCREQDQLKRLVTRDNITEKLARQMISAQLSNQERINRSDFQIRNWDNDDPSAAVEQIHKALITETH